MEIIRKTKNPVRVTAVLAAIVAAILLLAACSPGDNDNDASLAGVLDGLSSQQVEALARGAPENVKSKGRLQPGKMFLIDVDQVGAVEERRRNSRLL